MAERKRVSLQKGEVPYFSWDRHLTNEMIHAKLKHPASSEWVSLASWIMREAAFRDVWNYLSPQEVHRHFQVLEPRLGRQRNFWRYIIGVWRELGKL